MLQVCTQLAEGPVKTIFHLSTQINILRITWCIQLVNVDYIQLVNVDYIDNNVGLV